MARVVIGQSNEGRGTRGEGRLFESYSSIVYRLSSIVRYRFFLFAGIFPYCLGQAIAFNFQKALNWRYSWLGFLGIFLVLVGVELFNEYFDAEEGGDRIFSLEPVNIPRYFFYLGLFVFFLAFIIGIYFTFQTGWPVLLFSFLGFLGAYFYVGPPLKWVSKGWGEAVIALCYGPLMVLGSYYIQTKKIDFIPFFASLICALFLFCLAIINEIPDFYQDRLVGKRNLVVRLGKKAAIRILSFSLTCGFVLLILGLSLKKIPLLAMAGFLILPAFVKSIIAIQKNYEDPKAFISAVNANISVYLVVMISLCIGYLI